MFVLDRSRSESRSYNGSSSRRRTSETNASSNDSAAALVGTSYFVQSVLGRSRTGRSKAAGALRAMNLLRRERARRFVHCKGDRGFRTGDPPRLGFIARGRSYCF